MNTKALARLWLYYRKTMKLCPSEAYDALLKCIRKRGQYIPFSQVSWFKLYYKQSDYKYL